MHKVILVLVAGLASAPALAATPEAYKALDEASSLACLNASKFRDAAFAPAPLHFSDKMGVDARLITGTYSQPHMKGKQGMALCLYNRATKQAEVVDAAPWMSRKQIWSGTGPNRR